MMVLLLIAGISISGFLFAWALVLIARKPVPRPDLSYLQKYGKPMTQEEIDYFTSTRFIGQTVMLKWSGLRGMVEQVTDSHAYLRFPDGTSGMYVFSCLVGLDREPSNVYSRRPHRSA